MQRLPRLAASFFFMSGNRNSSVSDRDSIGCEAKMKPIDWLAISAVLLKQKGLKMQTLVVDLILAAGMCAIFVIALRGGKDEKG
jgi:hypothetical protein